MIKLVKSSFYHEAETKKALIDFISSAKIFSMGKECKEFEQGFAKKQERKFAVFVNSGSSANLVLIQAMVNLGRLRRGDRVGFSALTWATNVMPLIQMGLIPVPLDCETETLNVSSQKLEKEIKNLQGLFLTNVLGFCGDINKISELCKKYNVVFLEDNCEAYGSRLYGKLLGNFGDASTFSFFVGHHFSTMEGGMICTDNVKLYSMCVMVRAHGWDRNLPSKTQDQLRKTAGLNNFYAKFAFYDLAYNVRPTEIQGVIGKCQIPYLDEIVGKRQQNFIIFQNTAKKNSDLLTLNVKHMETISNFDMPVVAKTKTLAEQYKKKFLDAGVEIRPIIAGDITLQPFYKKYVKERVNLPNSRLVHKNGFYFPNNPELTGEEIKLLCGLLKQ